MPTYDIVNGETNEHHTIFCKYSELEQYLIVGDHIVKRMDGGMKEVFSRVAEGHPNSPLAERFGDNRSITKKKVESLGRKHGLIKDGSQIVPELSNTYKTT